MIREKMQNIQMKRVVILSIPYLIIFYLADKLDKNEHTGKEQKMEHPKPKKHAMEL